MSKDEIKYEINKALDQMSDKTLEDLLTFIKRIDRSNSISLLDKKILNQILLEDKELLQKLAQ